MGNFKNVLTTTKPQNHFALVFTRVPRHIEQAKAIRMIYLTTSGEVCGGRQVVFLTQLPGRQKLILPTLDQSDIDTENNLTPRPVVVRGKGKVFWDRQLFLRRMVTRKAA